jgi:ankyrin repeat protein
MENWANLDRLLMLERNDARRKKDFTQKLIDFCTKGEKESVRTLLKEGASLNCHEDMLTPLIASIENDHYELASYLLKAGASISFRPTEKSLSAFWYALKNRHHRYIELFVENRCILDWDMEDNMPPLIYATEKSDLNAVEILINHYAIKINERDGNGDTALNYNIKKASPTHEDIRIGQLLIAAGADTSEVNLEGKTPEELAADYAARAMLLSSKLDRDLPVNPEPELTAEEEALDEELGIKRTNGNKMKI